MTPETTWQRPPAPSSISAEAQGYLGRPPEFDNSAQPTDSTDLEAWERYIADMDVQIAKRFGGELPEPPIPVDTLLFDGVTTYTAQPEGATEHTPIYIDLHGGGLIMGGGEMLKFVAAIGALMRGTITWALDYRMPPRHPYPAALDDCVALYEQALTERPPDRIFVSGASAGGNLAAALILRLKSEGIPMPRAVVLLSPEVDLTESGDTFRTHRGIDHLDGELMAANLLYADGHDLADPYLSPLFGDLEGFPPTFLQTGTRDKFLSNTVRMHRALLAAGTDAQLHVWEAMPHGGFGGMSPEDREVAAAVGTFLAEHG